MGLPKIFSWFIGFCFTKYIFHNGPARTYVLALWVILCIQACRGLVNQFVGLMWISEYWVSVRQTYEMFQCTGLKFNLQIVWFATKLYTWVAKVATMKGDRAVENLSSRGRFSHKTICLFVLIRFACLHFACQFQPMLWEVYVSSDYGLKKKKMWRKSRWQCFQCFQSAYWGSMSGWRGICHPSWWQWWW